ncbi:IS4 family transposase, partial [Kitasatospora sp. NPDC059817]
HQAALNDGLDVDRLSFTRSLRVVRRQVPAQAAFSPRQTRPRTDPHPD